MFVLKLGLIDALVLEWAVAAVYPFLSHSDIVVVYSRAAIVIRNAKKTVECFLTRRLNSILDTRYTPDAAITRVFGPVNEVLRNN